MGPRPDTCESVAFLYDDVLDHEANVPAVEAALRASGAEVVAVTHLPIERASYATEVNPLVSAAPECFLLAVDSDVAERVRQHWIDAGGPEPRAWILGRDYFTGPGGGRLLDGFVGAAQDLIEPGDAPWNAFRDAYVATFGEPSFWLEDDQAAHYDALVLLAGGFEAADTTHPDAFAAAVIRMSRPDGGEDERTFSKQDFADGWSALASGQDVNFQGVSGNVDLKANGYPLTHYDLYELHWTGTELVREFVGTQHVER